MIIGLKNEIFSNVKIAFEFLSEHHILPAGKVCVKCGGEAILLLYSENEKQRIIYRCKVQGCRSKTTIFRQKLGLPNLLELIYLLMNNSTYSQLYNYYGYSDKTIWNVRKRLFTCFKQYIDARPITLGGEGMLIEIDETVISRRGIIRNPTSTDDTVRDTVWIVGAVDNTPSKNFYLTRVENRTIEVLAEALRNRFLPGSTLHSDGHPSYPAVSRNLEVVHRVVNHSLGFVSPDGTHTNNIEGFWSHFKATMRKENGVKRTNIDLWIAAYSFKRRYLPKRNREEFARIYIDILKDFLN